jgi:hypothetical protein
MQADELKPGDIVAGLEPDEHVEVRRVAPFRGKTIGHKLRLAQRCQG